MPQIKINGVEHTIDAYPHMPLLWAIRDIVGLTGTKFGCCVGGCSGHTVITNVSMRDLLKVAAAASGLVLGCHVGSRKLPFAEAAEAPTFSPNAFLAIDETGLVTIVASRSEMGTGIKTDLPL